jgi:hypothetical protein
VITMTCTQIGEDVLVQPLEALEQALGAEFPGHEREWLDQVGTSLSNVEQAFAIHRAGAEGPGGLFAKVDLTRPTLVRQVSHLRREHSELLDKAQSLHRDLESSAQAFAPAGDVLAASSPLPEPAPGGTVANFNALRQEIGQFVTALHQHASAETNLLLESVNTDIGVGD